MKKGEHQQEKKISIYKTILLIFFRTWKWFLFYNDWQIYIWFFFAHKLKICVWVLCFIWYCFCHQKAVANLTRLTVLTNTNVNNCNRLILPAYLFSFLWFTSMVYMERFGESVNSISTSKCFWLKFIEDVKEVVKIAGE